MQSFLVQLLPACEIIIVPIKTSCCCRQGLAAALSFKEDPYLRRHQIFCISEKSVYLPVYVKIVVLGCSPNH